MLLINGRTPALRLERGGFVARSFELLADKGCIVG
jgi:hypothetical protein